MPVLEKPLPETVRLYRETTFNTRPGSALRSAEQAIQFVKKRGYILFWPNKELDFPSLWCAVASDRPVADNHDDPAHKTWRWKDDLLGKNRWYYAKIIRQRSTIISLEMLPFFYALSPNYGSPEEDYFIAYQDGLLSNEEKTVYETILKNGPLDTLTLRESAGLAASESSSRFNRALNLLQRDFRILPVGVSDRGAWHYTFIYEASHRQFPELVAQAKTISDNEARKQILKAFLLALGVVNMKQMHRFFQWPDCSIRQTLEGLMDERYVAPTSSPLQSSGEWFTITGLEK